MPEAYLISGARSPLVIPPSGQPDGAFAPQPPAAQAAGLLEQALRSAGLRPDKVDLVYWAGDEPVRDELEGQGWGPVIGVQAGAVSAHLALHLAAQAILAGDIRAALVGSASSAGTPGSARLPLRAAQGWAKHNRLTRAELDEAARRAVDSTARVAVDGALAPLEPAVPAEPSGRVQRVTTAHFHPFASGAGAVLLAGPSAVGALNLAPRAALSARAVERSREGFAWDAVFDVTRQALSRLEEDSAPLERACLLAPFIGVELAWQKMFAVDGLEMVPQSAFYGPASGILGLLNLVEALEQSKTRLGLLASAANNGAVATVIERT